MSRLVRLVMLAAVAVALASPLAACGKKGKLQAPPGEQSDYPRHYPQ